MLSNLEFGTKEPILVREEFLELGLGLKILYASDLHLRPANQERIRSELRATCEEHRPDALLLGGDLADHMDCLSQVTTLVSKVSKLALVGAVPGNHDTLIGKSKIREAVIRGGGHWLQDAPVQIGDLKILGSVEQHDSTGISLLCHHYPTVFPSAYNNGIRVVFAGHLHGWQIVLGQMGEYLYPGAWLSRWNGLRFERKGSTMFVSRGMTDLFPLRWNCPREVILARL